MKSEQNKTESDSFPLEIIDAKIALLMVEKPASTDQEIADKLGISRQTVNRRKKSDAVQKIVRSTLAIPEKEMRRLAAKALARIESHLDNEDPKIQLSAALALVRLSERFIGNELSLGY